MTVFSTPTRLAGALLALALAGCGSAARAPATDPEALRPKDAEPATRAAQAAVRAALPFADRADYDDATRGFVDTLPGGLVRGEGGEPVWSMQRYDFLQRADPPATVNPSLWRQAQLNNVHGLFRVADRVWQVRGLDLANMTIVEGETGLIVTDTLLSTETARAGLELYYAHRPRAPIVAVIYSHSHVDHYGGVAGLVSDADVRQGRVRLIAPDGFMEQAVSENLIAGPAMGRRAQYMYGPLLPVGERGQVDTGLGKNLSRGTTSLIAPNDLIRRTDETRTIDGVTIEFHLVPGSEAPAEMIMYYPQLRLLDMAEDATHTLHNLYTLRGAQVRDGRLWSRYLGEALERWGRRSDALIAQHHWPTWGQARIVDYLARQRDLYKFVHDQSVRLMNRGFMPEEIAERIKLPPSLAAEWSARDYYGTVRHDSKAVYQYYLGWYDANPADLDPLPPVEAARKAVEYMGGADAVVARARADFAAGHYRWVASVLKQVVFADPAHREARALAADALEQLGYQAEAGTWRNVYLSGAAELRRGPPKPTPRPADETLRAVPVDLVFDTLATRLDPARAEGRAMVLNWRFTDTGQLVVVTLDHSALTTALPAAPAPAADAGFTLDRATFDAIVSRRLTVAAAIEAGALRVEGDPRRLGELMAMLEAPPTAPFPIVDRP